MANASAGDSRGRLAFVLAGAVAVPLLVGFLGSLATRDHVDGWYASANQAPWTPPNAVFGPTWTVLYILMGVASWLLWRERRNPLARKALRWYLVQLVFNAIWTPLFFAGYPNAGAVMLWVAFADIVLLIISLVVTMRSARKVSLPAFTLLIPLLIWVAYASTLNLYMAIMND